MRSLLLTLCLCLPSVALAGTPAETFLKSLEPEVKISAEKTKDTGESLILEKCTLSVNNKPAGFVDSLEIKENNGKITNILIEGSDIHGIEFKTLSYNGIESTPENMAANIKTTLLKSGDIQTLLSNTQQKFYVASINGTGMTSEALGFEFQSFEIKDVTESSTGKAVFNNFSINENNNVLATIKEIGWDTVSYDPKTFTKEFIDFAMDDNDDFDMAEIQKISFPTCKFENMYFSDTVFMGISVEKITFDIETEKHLAKTRCHLQKLGVPGFFLMSFLGTPPKQMYLFDFENNMVFNTETSKLEQNFTINAETLFEGNGKILVDFLADNNFESVVDIIFKNTGLVLSSDFRKEILKNMEEIFPEKTKEFEKFLDSSGETFSLQKKLTNADL